jgi:hypothetical protein
MAALSKEEFYNKQYLESLGGGQGLVNQYYGKADARSYETPSYSQFQSGTSTYAHRHDGKVYNLYAIDKAAMLNDFNTAYDAYVAGEEAKTKAAEEAKKLDESYTKQAGEIGKYAGESRTGTTGLTGALAALSGARNYGASELGTKLNFQVNDDQIINDYNTSKLNSLKSVVDRGNTQLVGIQEKLNSSNALLANLKADDARRAPLEASIKTLNEDLKSVNEAITSAQTQVADFKPITATDTAGQKEITSFRQYLQLPEERATEQLKQIDPKAYETAVALGEKYRGLATEPLPATTSEQTEALRSQLEQEAINQLRLGSTLGAEERRGYEQAVRAAQTARGNIFGVAPATEEAVTTGLLGEQRKLARYGAAQSFLSSGQTTGDALQRDLALRDALLQSRLGAAAGFVASGPSIYNLSNARTGQQNTAFQNYIQANQSLPGNFGQGASTASNFYQTTNPDAGVNLSNISASLYNTLANYQSSNYGNYIKAVSSQPNGFQNFATLAGGISDLANAGTGVAKMGIACWVAREVYGIDNPKWLQFREWMFTKASDNLRNFYLEYGERIAESIRNKPKIKAIIRKWMDGKIG